MTKYTIYSDLHIGAPYEIKEKLKFGKNVIFLGDNFDISYVLKKNVPKIKKLREETLRKVKKSGSIFIDGNHELKGLDSKKDFIKIKKTLFLHGDLIDKSLKKAIRWRKQKPGFNKLVWNLCGIYRKIYKGHVNKLNKKMIKRALELAKKFEVNQLVLGHFHPKKLRKFEINGVKIFLIPRGKTVLKI